MGISRSYRIVRGWRGDLIVSVLDSGASGPGSSPGRGHCVVFLGTLLSQCLSPPRCINGYRRSIFPFRKRSMPFLTVVAIIGNRAFQNGRCHICCSLGLEKVETGYNLLME